MIDWKNKRFSPRSRLSLVAAAALALGAVGGAGAVHLTRPAVEMAPTVPMAIARLPQTSGIVTVKGRVAETYGDRFVLQDGSGRTLVASGREGSNVQAGSTVTVQGRYDDGQLRASYLVDAQGTVRAVGRPPHGFGRDGGPPHPGHGRDVPPPPPPPGAEPGAPPPVAAGQQPPAPPAGAAPPPPAASPTAAR
jgi:uncharacterized protein YdeI (BOF family)